MRKQTIQYHSPVDALVALTRRLIRYEIRYGLESEAFFERYSHGQIADEADFVEWANDYQHYLALRNEIDQSLRHAA